MRCEEIYSLSCGRRQPDHARTGLPGYRADAHSAVLLKKGGCYLAPIASNEPDLSSGLAVITSLLDHLVQVSIPAERTILLGFSQGACLSLEYIARNARRYGGVVGLSGGLLGPDGTPRDYPGSLAGTPVFLGCSDMDPHIPKERVEQAAEALRLPGGNVTTRLYPHMDHTVNQDELHFVQSMMASALSIGN